MGRLPSRFVAVLACGLAKVGCGGSSINTSENGDEAGRSGDAGTASGGTSGSSGSSSGGVGALGGANTGGSDAGGTSGAAGAPACSDSDVSPSDPFANLKVRGTTTGTNGTFEDGCDDGDNLVEHTCEIACVAALPRSAGAGGTTSSGAGIPCRTQVTGRVLESVVSCGGRCVDGTCFHWCMAPNEMTTVHTVADRVLLSWGDYLYDCTVGWQAQLFDCQSPNLVGHRLRVVNLGACSADEIALNVDDPSNGSNEDCRYLCSVIPP